ncbi:MAG TPA: hypothetical protein VHD90_13740 [Phototrophicaceae bacterium]|nr:hypothetical protein [Phototrophicaceae bacterium]
MKPEAESEGISGLTVAFVVVGLLACALVFGLIFIFTAQPTTDQQIAAIHAQDSAFNMEQTTPNADAQALAATQAALLQGYGWVDQGAGIARIPIDRAMQLIVTEQPKQTATPPP